MPARKPAKKPSKKATVRKGPVKRPVAKKAKPPAAAPAPRVEEVVRKPPPKLVLEEPKVEPAPPLPPELLAPVPTITPEDLAASLPPPEPGRNQKRFILLDTNALMMQFQFSVDIENELRRILDFPYEIVVPDIVLGELRNLAQTAANIKDRGEAVMAMRLAMTFRIVKTEGPADTGILRVSDKLGAIVVTNDKILRARLRAKNVPNIHLRSKAFLTVEGHIGF